MICNQVSDILLGAVSKPQDRTSCIPPNETQGCSVNNKTSTGKEQVCKIILILTSNFDIIAKDSQIQNNHNNNNKKTFSPTRTSDFQLKKLQVTHIDSRESQPLRPTKQINGDNIEWGDSICRLN